MSDFDAGKLEPGKLADVLGVTLEELAALAGIHCNTMSRTPYGPQAQAGMGPVVSILTAVNDLMADPKSLDRAVIWFKNQPLPGFGGKTAYDLVLNKQAKAVMDYLGELADGGYA